MEEGHRGPQTHDGHDPAHPAAAAVRDEPEPWRDRALGRRCRSDAGGLCRLRPAGPAGAAGRHDTGHGTDHARGDRRPGPLEHRVHTGPGFADVDEDEAAIFRDAVGAFAELGAHVVEARPDWEQVDQAMRTGVWVPGLAGLRDLLDWPAMRGRLAEELIDIVLLDDTLSAADVARGEALRGGV